MVWLVVLQFCIALCIHVGSFYHVLVLVLCRVFMGRVQVVAW